MIKQLKMWIHEENYEKLNIHITLKIYIVNSLLVYFIRITAIYCTYFRNILHRNPDFKYWLGSSMVMFCTIYLITIKTVKSLTTVVAFLQHIDIMLKWMMKILLYISKTFFIASDTGFVCHIRSQFENDFCRQVRSLTQYNRIPNTLPPLSQVG